nr:HlyD family efflux transporter periplasmic adaptor subunit [uncultured Roseateles sp.]
MSAADPNVALLSLLQLQRRAREASTPEALGFVMVNETLQLLPYRQAVLWSEAGMGKVAAVSGLPQPDSGAPYVQWVGRLCRYLMRSLPDPGAAPETASSLNEVAPDLLPEALRADWPQWLPASALWLRLGQEANQAGEPAEAGLLLTRDEPWLPHEKALLQELAHAYAHALHAFAPRQAWRGRISAALSSKSRPWWLAGLLLLSLCPVRLTALAPAEVVPQNPFMVRAPLDGVIERFDIHPNEVVQPGTPLFSLDTSVLRTRMELARKALDAAQEEYRQSAQAAVTSDKSRAETALRRGKLQEKAVEVDYTAEQLARIQVKADRKGVAVFADANDWVGKTVSLGERVLLIADPAQVELLAWLPAADLLPLAPGDRLTLYPQGAPLQSFDARISSVAYRAEMTRDGFLAYRIKASFEAGQAPPRIGQLGSARLQGGWAPLIYVALRRPLAVARQWLGW